MARNGVGILKFTKELKIMATRRWGSIFVGVLVVVLHLGPAKSRSLLLENWSEIYCTKGNHDAQQSNQHSLPFCIPLNYSKLHPPLAYNDIKFGPLDIKIVGIDERTETVTYKMFLGIFWFCLLYTSPSPRDS